MRIKLTCSVLLLSISIAFAQDYTPLTRAERKAFIKAANAIKIAMEEEAYDGVTRFGNSILKRYESILLDPKAKKLRELYSMIEDVVRKVEDIHKADSLEAELKAFEDRVKKLAETSDFLNALKAYDDYLDALKEREMGEDVIEEHTQKYKEYMLGYFDGTYFSLQALSGLRHSDKDVLDSLRHDVEKSIKDVFLAISSTSNVQDLYDFKRQFPGLYEREVGDLINNFRMKLRVNLRRRPNLEKVEQYYSLFPERDKIVDAVHEKLLYDDFKKNSDIIAASKYLASFPQGKYARELRTFIEVQQEQQRLAQLQMLQATTLPPISEDGF